MSDYDTDLPAAYPDARRRAEAEVLGLPEGRLWTLN